MIWSDPNWPSLLWHFVIMHVSTCVLAKTNTILMLSFTSFHSSFPVNLTDTLGSIGAALVAVAAHFDLLLARVGAHSVDTVKAWAAWLTQAAALIYVCRNTQRKSEASGPLEQWHFHRRVIVRRFNPDWQTYLCLFPHSHFTKTIM